jgi:hypothetical protein
MAARRQENMEDLVTSMIFGTLEHCDPMDCSPLQSTNRGSTLLGGRHGQEDFHELDAITADGTAAAHPGRE